MTWPKLAQPSWPTDDRRAQVDVVVLEGDRAELPPPLDELRLPRLERPLQPAVVGEVDVVRDLGVDVDGASSRSASDPRPVEGGAGAGAEAAQRALGADGVGALEDPVLPGGQAGEDLASPSSPDRRSGRLASIAGERVGREAVALLEHQAHLVVPVEVVGRERHEPASGPSAARRSLPMSARGGLEAGRRAPEPCAQAGRLRSGVTSCLLQQRFVFA